ncbi:Transcription factor COE, DNA-binding domain [Sergentomyia squamirostris]
MSMSEQCALCEQALRDREKASKSIKCFKCKGAYHLKCSGLEPKKYHEVIAKCLSWFCPRCKRLSAELRNSAQKNGATRSKSVSDEGAIESTALAREDRILEELDEMTNRLATVKKVVISTNQETITETPRRGDKTEKWEEISKKIDVLNTEIESIKSIIREHGERVTKVEEALTQEKNQNQKLKVEIVQMRTSLEIDRQRQRNGDIIICGLPPNVEVNPEQVFKKLCEKLEIQPDDRCNPYMKVMRVHNKSVNEQRLEVKNLGPVLVNLVIQKSRELIKNKRHLTSNHLMNEGDSKNVYVNHYLTGYFQLLFKKARDMKKKKLIKHVWTSEGMLFGRKEDNSRIVHLKHTDDLEKFIG